MTSKKAKLSTLAFFLILAISGASFGFLVGQSHRLADTEASVTAQSVTGNVQTGGAVITKVWRGVRYLLIQ